MKRLLLTMLTVGTILTCKAQSDGYLHYTPIPLYTPPPSDDYQLPQIYMPPPPPQAYNHSESQPAPTVNVAAEFLIYSAKINGRDYSQHYQNSKAGIALYTFSNNPNQSYFAVVMPAENSSSTGPMTTVTTRETPQTDKDYGMTTITFTWEFTNNPNGSKGTANVTLTKQYRPQGTAFLCDIQSSNGEVIEFMGMMTQ
ncbi:MAG: hypothetical protein ACTHJ8_20290 [Mucilaginibacter sp.]